MPSTNPGKKAFKCPTFAVPAKNKSETDTAIDKATPKDEEAAEHSDDAGQAVEAVDLQIDSGSSQKLSDDHEAEKSEVKDTIQDEEDKKSVSEKSTGVEEACSTEKPKKFSVNPSKPEENQVKTTEASTLRKEKKLSKPFQVKKSKPDDCGKSNLEVKPVKKDRTEKKRKVEENGENLGHSEKKKMVAIRDGTEKKPKKDKAPKAQPKPERSLTDDEYEAIFKAVLERVSSIQTEETCDISVGLGPGSFEEIAEVCSMVETEEKKQEMKMDRKKEKAPKPPSLPVRSLTDEEYDSIFTAALEVTGPDAPGDIVEEESETVNPPDNDTDSNSANEDAPDVAAAAAEGEEDLAQDLPDARAMSAVQQMNETTPEGSEHEYGSQPPPASPPPKKKIINKKDKLEPRQLPFSGKSDEPLKDENHGSDKGSPLADTCSILKNLEESVTEKIKKLKAMQNEHKKFNKKKQKRVCREDKQKQAFRNDMPVSSKVPKKRSSASKRKEMLAREVATDGTWVMCCNTDCQKWRHLTDIHDPATIPEKWDCSMNSNEDFNSCDKPEEEYDESEHIYTQFTEGSVVWAKMTGYPWWPAMVEVDPDVETYFETDAKQCMVPTNYHVVFFDDKVSRAWVKACHCKLFTGLEKDDGIKLSQKEKKGGHRFEIEAAKKHARAALNISLTERIKRYSFAVRYHGRWGSCMDQDDSKTIKVNLKKRNKTAGRKLKTGGGTSAAKAEAVLDDPTMTDVLNNTESLLDNVEDVLESLDSDTLEEEDSDFMPEDHAKEEKKKRAHSSKDDERSCGKKAKTVEQSVRKSGHRIRIVFSDPEDESAAECDKAKRSKKTEDDIAEEQDSNSFEQLAELEDIEVENINSTTVKPMVLDSDVFTMELGCSQDKGTENGKASSETWLKAPAKASPVKFSNEGEKSCSGGIDTPPSDSSKGKESQETDSSVNLEMAKDTVNSQDSVVPDIQINKAEVNPSSPTSDRDHRLSDTNEEGSEFDLNDESMYGPEQSKTIDLSSSVLPVALPVVEFEDSDPFDIMEE